MENASKALLISAGVLVAILILSIGITLYSMFSEQSKSYATEVSKTETQKINADFVVYIGRENISPYEVISAINKAKEYNNSIQVVACNKNGTVIRNNDSTRVPEEFLKDFKDSTFKCVDSSVTYNYEGKITNIKFIEN